MAKSKKKTPAIEPEWVKDLNALDATLRWGNGNMEDSAKKLFAFAHHIGVSKRDALNWFEYSINATLTDEGRVMVKKWADAGYEMNAIPPDQVDGWADRLIAAGDQRDIRLVKDAWKEIASTENAELQAVLFRVDLRNKSVTHQAQRGMKGETIIKDELRSLEHAAWLFEYRAAISTVYAALSEMPEVLERAREFLKEYDRMMPELKEDIKRWRADRQSD